MVVILVNLFSTHYLIWSKTKSFLPEKLCTIIDQSALEALVEQHQDQQIYEY